MNYTNFSNIYTSCDMHLPVCIIERGVEYEFRIAGQNHIGFGQESIKHFLTPEGPPSGPPTNISHHFQTPDVVCVTWDIPLKEHRNGQITHYDIEFHKKVDHTTVTDRNTTQTKVPSSNTKVSLGLVQSV
jgi:netrin-G3 ligand